MHDELKMSATVSSDDFREIIGHFASGVTVITAVHDGTRCGATASAVSSLSLDPPMMLICLSKQASTSQTVAASGRFVVNILAEDQVDIAMRFAGRSATKFDGLKVGLTHWGGPFLPQALANIDCRVVEQVSGGTHSVFLAQVEGATRQVGAPLAYFRGKFGRLMMEQDDLAYHEIRERLTRRTFPIGQPLDLDDLASKLGVPKGSVYHSLARGVHEGLVERSSEGSFIIPEVSLEALLDALTALFGILLGAIQISIGKLSARHIDEMRVLLVELKPLKEAGGVWTSRDFLKARGNFVNAFLRATGSVTMVEAFSRADVQSMVAFCWSGAGALTPSEYDTIYQGFAEVFRAAEAADSAAATRAIQSLHVLTEDLFRASFLKHQHSHSGI